MMTRDKERHIFQKDLTELERRAYLLAAWFHRKQVRKYTNQPYRFHLLEVALMVKAHGGSREQVLAAIFHDILEDTYLTKTNLATILYGIWQKFIGTDQMFNIQVVLKYVVDLTDVCTHENMPSVNRKMRKQLEAFRLGQTKPEVQTIKYADLINNTESIVERDEDFARTYLQEKIWLLKEINRGNAFLYRNALITLFQGMNKLGLYYSFDFSYRQYAS